MEPLVDLPVLTQPPTKGYWITTTQRHKTSKRRGKERGCKLVCETRTAEGHCQSKNLLHISFSVWCLVSSCVWEGTKAQQVCRLVLLGVHTGGGAGGGGAESSFTCDTSGNTRANL